MSDGSEPTYRGYRLADLVRHATFDDVVGILLDGRLPARPVRPTAGLLGAPPAGTGSSATAYLTLLLGLLPDRPYSAADACGALRDLAAALARHDAGAVRGDAGLAEQILAACLPARRQDRIEDPYAVRAFEQDLIIHAEHGLCASALVARVAASTGAAAGSCLAAAAHTFAGPRHGGALPAVAAMARRLRSPAEAAAHLRERVLPNRFRAGLRSRGLPAGGPNWRGQPGTCLRPAATGSRGTTSPDRWRSSSTRAVGWRTSGLPQRRPLHGTALPATGLARGRVPAGVHARPDGGLARPRGRSVDQPAHPAAVDLLRPPADARPARPRTSPTSPTATIPDRPPTPLTAGPG